MSYEAERCDDLPCQKCGKFNLRWQPRGLRCYSCRATFYRRTEPYTCESDLLSRLAYTETVRDAFAQMTRENVLAAVKDRNNLIAAIKKAHEQTCEGCPNCPGCSAAHDTLSQAISEAM